MPRQESRNHSAEYIAWLLVKFGVLRLLSAAGGRVRGMRVLSFKPGAPGPPFDCDCFAIFAQGKLSTPGAISTSAQEAPSLRGWFAPPKVGAPDW